ncbi:MAG: hypothetical protein N2246_03420 [Candidatus Sumerlaeia bacterium]|nr:hypothetical protein [Candidatus Sumerlaeia bacterium]
MADLIQKNEESFTLLDEALKCPVFQTPLATEFELGDRVQYSNLRDFAMLSAIKAIYLFKLGKEQEAFDEALKLLRLGHLIEGAPDNIVSYFIGGAIKGFGVGIIRQMLKEANLPEEKIREYSVEVSKYKANEEGLIKSAKWEYMTLCKMIDNLITEDSAFSHMNASAGKTSSKNKQKKIPGYFFKPNKTKRIIGERYRTFINSISYPFAKMKITEDPSFYGSSPNFLFMLRENSIGKYFYNISVPKFKRMLLSKCNEDFRVSATATLMALKAYKIKTGTLPVTLDQLVPEYLSAVPVDPFDGKPLRYSPDKRIIYAVGADLVDSGGNITGKQDDAEPTVIIEF